MTEIQEFIKFIGLAFGSGLDTVLRNHNNVNKY